MSRSGYSDDLDTATLNLYRGNVANATRGKRGQAFLRELAEVMDAMPTQELIYGELINDKGDVCAIGTVCKARGLDVADVDAEDPEEVGQLVGIATCLAAEIEWMNDEGDWGDGESPAKRWTRMRKWVGEQIITGE